MGQLESDRMSGSGPRRPAVGYRISTDIALNRTILIYSGIDTVGWLDSTQEEASRDSFLGWVENYFLRAKPIGSTSLELYAAQCGLLHTLTPDSRLSEKKKARLIAYAWGQASVSDLQRSIDSMGLSSELVAVHANDLFEGWRLGVLAFAKELEHDPARKACVEEKAAKFFLEFDSGMMRDVNAILDQCKMKPR
jgi:hypothetical protein